MPPSTPIPRGATALAVFVGGAAGAALRWWIGELPPLAGGFPFATFSANLIGSAGLGYLAGIVFARPGRAVAWPLLGVGLAGALTTFSTFVVETVDLAAADGPAAALLYAGSSVLAGLWLAERARAHGAAR